MAFAAMIGGPAGSGSSLRNGAIRMVLCLVCGFAGAFAMSRGLRLTQVFVAGAVVVSLAAAIYSGVLGRLASPFAAIVPLAFVVLSAAFDGTWSPIIAAVLAAIPFGLCAVLYPRPSARGDALFCAVTGAALGLVPAVMVLFIATLAAIGIAKATKATAATMQFGPYVAGITLLGVLTNLVFAV